MKTLDDVRADLASVARILGASQPDGSLAWKVGNLAAAALADLEAVIQQTPPLPAVLDCPDCGEPHVDEGEWARRPHRTHLCAACGHTWRPHPLATTGVAALSRPAAGWVRCADRMPAEGEEVLVRHNGMTFCANLVLARTQGEPRQWWWTRHHWRYLSHEVDHWHPALPAPEGETP